MILTLDHASRSDRGLVRHDNQDVLYAGRRLVAVADGMGGHVGGAIAARLTVTELAAADTEPDPGAEVGLLARAVQTANRALADRVGAQPDLAGMGTTLTAILFGDSMFALAHIGDSRAYLFRDGQLVQLTHDESVVQSLLDAGRITAEQAAHNPYRSLILRALTGEPLQPVLVTQPVYDGDRFLLCSDGLSTLVDDDVLAETLTGRNPGDAVEGLMDLALVGGGRDNVSIIVGDITVTGAPPRTPVRVAGGREPGG